MRISVVTPSFNMGRYLEGTIASVFANLRVGDEYFVIDGGSTDESVDVLKRNAQQITGWVSEPDNGYADAIAKGFARASGDILCWINAGDLYLTGAFDTVRKLFEKDADLIFGDDFYVDEDSKVLAFSRGWVPDLRAATLYGGWTPLQDACFWRRDLYQRVGGIDRTPAIRCGLRPVPANGVGWPEPLCAGHLQRVPPPSGAEVHLGLRGLCERAQPREGAGDRGHSLWFSTEGALSRYPSGGDEHARSPCATPMAQARPDRNARHKPAVRRLLACRARKILNRAGLA